LGHQAGWRSTGLSDLMGTGERTAWNTDVPDEPAMSDEVGPWCKASGLQTMLEEGHQRGAVGPGAILDHVRHALGFVEALGGPTTQPTGPSQPTGPTQAQSQPAAEGNAWPRLLDLGSGGGLPGLVMALYWPDVHLALLDSQRRRTAFLEEAIDHLALSHRVVVICDRAEAAGRDPLLRGRFDAVVARAFGPPAVTAECGSPFLRTGGCLVVSEPPVEVAWRWPVRELDCLGLTDGGSYRFWGFGYRRLIQAAICPSRYPRRTGVPSKRPLFHVKPH